MSDTQKHPPAPRKDMPTGATLLIMLFVLAVTGPLLYYFAAPKVDLYKHGKVTDGTVKSAISREYREKGINKTSYEHFIEYDGHAKAFVRKYRLEKGAKVAIYYSAQDPKNAVIKEQGQPYTSYADILLEPAILLLSVVNALFLGAFMFIVKVGMDERRAKERAL